MLHPLLCHLARPVSRSLTLRWYVPITLIGLLCLFFPIKTSHAIDLVERVHETTLPNGIRLLVLERQISPTVSFYIRHKVGAINEEEGRTGMAHMLEHMMFKGTTTIGTSDYETEASLRRQIDKVQAKLDKMATIDGKESAGFVELSGKLSDLRGKKNALIISNEIDRIYRERGGVGLNATTGYDLTSYMVSLPSNSIEVWARVESDRLLNPVFREFLPERDVVLEERRQTVYSRPERQLMELFLGAVFHAHPYGRPILGWSDDIRRFDRDYVERFFNTYYRPSGMVIAVAGDVSAYEVESLVYKYFGPLENREENILLPRFITPEPPQHGERRVALAADANPRVLIGYRKPPAPSFDNYVFDLIETLLSRGRSSRLYRSLVTEMGIAGSVFATNGFPGALHENLFVLGAEPLEGIEISDLELAIYNELDRLKREPVPGHELEKAKNQLKADYYRQLGSNSGLAALLSYTEAIIGDFRYMATYLDEIESIDSLDIMKAASDYFLEINRTVAFLERVKTP